SKFNDAIFMTAIVLAALSVPGYRPAILTKRFLISLVVAALALMPSVVWSISNMDAVLARTRKLQITAGGFLETRLNGFVELVEAFLNFSIMTLAIAAICFVLARQNPLRVEGPSPDNGLVGRVIALGLG